MFTVTCAFRDITQYRGKNGWEFKGTVGAGVFLSVEALSFSVISPSLGVSA